MSERLYTKTHLKDGERAYCGCGHSLYQPLKLTTYRAYVTCEKCVELIGKGKRQSDGRGVYPKRTTKGTPDAS